ncbi:MAG TPA: hypothetical protein VMU39_20705 [Solirubrobacteraceae bacterium]|nr:hypothetical protein [Solirubrobacteraceae bacterium]
MTLTHKDAVAISLTGLAVLAFLATQEAWNVPLVGHSHRWAAALILACGVAACAVGGSRSGAPLFGVLGTAALLFGVVALLTGSLTLLSLLVVDLVLMWAIATLRHAHVAPGRPVAH